MPAWMDLRKLLCVLALAGAVAGGMLPVGWMPHAGPNGMSLVICTAQGPLHIQVDETGALIENGDAQELANEAPCPFAVTPAAALVNGDAAMHRVSLDRPRHDARPETPIVGPAAAPPGSRGPPAHNEKTRLRA